MKTRRVRGAPSEAEAYAILHMDSVCFPADARVAPADDAWWWITRTDSGVPIAYAALEPGSSPGTAYLSRAGVMPGFRGHGLQRRLIAIRVRAAATAGYHRAVTYTARDNLASANNLIAAGFRLYEPVSPWGMTDALYFKKNL